MIGNLKCMVQLLFRMNHEFSRDIHIGGAFEHLRIVDVGDNCLILAREILVQRCDEYFTRHCSTHNFWHRFPPADHVHALKAASASGYYGSMTRILPC